ncbi:hypothetical protein TWF696_004856 [Orbilia brochopaga]|uniref:Uncharacterized protein n=1 Tax=Orbilia brochopaga TaxID=3140254 RepID=A0AAV9UYZ2_9PEZI
MAVDISIPSSFELNHKNIVKIGIALTYSTPFYRTITMTQATDDLFARAKPNCTASVSDLLGIDFQKTAEEIPIFELLGQQPGFVVATVLKGHFATLPHGSMRDVVMIPAIVLPILAAVAVLLRFFTRKFLTRLVRLEDCC